MKILNLYAGLGGNRKLWGDEHQITAVEYNESIANVYRHYFPNDTVVVGDAHQYLLDHYKEFDFIWSSNPCQTHSKARYWRSKGGAIDVKYPDMSLYQTIIFLQHYFKGGYTVENVDPFYTPLIPPTKKIGRHLFWTNFKLGDMEIIEADIQGGNIGEWEKLHGFDLSGFKIDNRKDQVLRNCVHPETGRHILNCFLGKVEYRQPALF